jgi:transposase-like protein
MAKPRDMAKEAFWRRIVRWYGASRLSTREFCAKHGISDWQLYWWRRELQARDARGHEDESAAADQDSDATAGDRFVELRLPISPASAVIEIVHPRGHVIRVSTASFDADLLRRILSALDSSEAT